MASGNFHLLEGDEAVHEAVDHELEVVGSRAFNFDVLAHTPSIAYAQPVVLL